jgi:threonine/homoserine/homoserine lactone efflux protein
MGGVSIVLLLALAFLFLRGAWRAFSARSEAGAPEPRLEGTGGAYALGAAMALTSPWNVAFWLAAMGRPELAGADAAHLMAMVAAVIAGALIWGLLWALFTKGVHGALEGAAKRWWTILVDAATGALMLYFAYDSMVRLIAAS